MPNPPTETPHSRQQVPLCVDLDGTLVRSDLLGESTFALVRRNPLYLFALPFWLLRGRARLKREVASRAALDVATLPYDHRLCGLVHAEGRVRDVVLCTAADQILADKVAAHVGGFREVIASDGTLNVSGRCKAATLVERFGDRGFDYAGNERRDLHVWRHARRAIVANSGRGLARRVERASELVEVFPREPAGIRAWLTALRPHQWLKNTLVFVPLIAAHQLLDPTLVARTLAAFVLFGLCASGVYILNDLLDLEADRRHPRKRNRAFASGKLALSKGLVVALSLTIVAFAGAYALVPGFALVLLGYYVMTIAYSLGLKRIVMLDVLTLAALYTVRILAGSAATGIAPSFWLLVFSMFLFLSLALVKRYTEVLAAPVDGDEPVPGRGYVARDYELLGSLGGSSGYLSALVLAMYINSAASEELYRRPEALWLLCPLLLYWISRIWIVAHRGAMHDDPVVFAVTDRVSLLVFVLGAAVILLAL